MSLPLAILAGGLATRLRPLTNSIPKSLLQVGGKAFIFHQLDLLSQRGVEHVVLCLGHHGDQIVEAVGDGSRWGLQIDCSFDGPVQLGTGGALKNAKRYLGEAFLVLYGDSYLDCDYMSVGKDFITSGLPGLMTVFRNSNQWDASNILYSNGRIEKYDKVFRAPEMHHIDYGLGGLRTEILDMYGDGALDLVSVYQDLISRNRLLGIEVPNRFYEIGSAKGLEETHNYLLRKARAQ